MSRRGFVRSADRSRLAGTASANWPSRAEALVSSKGALFDAASSRAEKLREGQEVDVSKLVELEPTRARPTSATPRPATGGRT